MTRKVNFVVGLGKVFHYMAIIISMIILLAPAIIVVFISFNPTEREAFPPTGFSLRWYVEFFQHTGFFEAFFYTSVPVALATAISATILGTMAAYALNKFELTGSNLIQTFLTTPIMVPAVIIGLALLLFFPTLGIENDRVQLVIGHTVRTFPYALLTTITALHGFDWDMERAARNLGASQFTTFRKIVLPMMSSGVIAAFLLAFIISFADVNIALFLSGTQGTTIPVEMYQFLLFETSPIIAAISTLQIIVVLVLVGIISFFVDLESIFTN